MPVNLRTQYDLNIARILKKSIGHLLKAIQPGQKQRPKEPEREREKNRTEVAAYFFLTFWVTADIFFEYGHSRIAVYVFGLALVFPLYLLNLHAQKAWPAWAKAFAVAFTFAIMGVPIFMARVSYLASFSAISETDIINYPLKRLNPPDFPGTFSWCVNTRTTRDANNRPVSVTEVSPVFILMYVRFTNDRDTPMFVDGFSVETRTPNGSWNRMPIFDVHPEYGVADFYNVGGADFQHAMAVDFQDNFLQSRLAGTSLGPHESVQGWLMLDIPKEGVADPYQMRFSIVTAGETIPKPITFPDPFKSVNSMDIQTIKPNPAFQTTSFKDISGIPLRYYGDGASLLTGQKQ